MLVPHLTSSNDPPNPVKHLADLAYLIRSSAKQTQLSALHHLLLSHPRAVSLALLKQPMEKRPESVS